ncbi:unnamed protein product [Nippostrongylus brasiliensis]|uniref:Nephrin (inferred by orthology to a human protein) n=1 Tax=Nippostrongylus brasiliensis TaxID=27835 RepID=A0A0N4XVS3_NIPBR|nr:unnamed protein product [Nippostrongylus brasiliensis]
MPVFSRYSQWRSNTGSLLGFHDVGQLAGHQGRYSYLKYSREELHLKIERVTLEDDGQFECQMLRPDEGPIRAAAYVNVIVPPKTVLFTNYQSGGILDVNEDIPLNITCEAPNAKPEAALTWRTDHKKVLTCEAVHDDSSTQIRINLTLNVLCEYGCVCGVVWCDVVDNPASLLL